MHFTDVGRCFTLGRELCDGYRHKRVNICDVRAAAEKQGTTKTALRLQTPYVVPSYFNIYNYCYLYADTVLPVPQKDKPAAVHAECGGEDALEAPVCLAVLPACGCHQAVLGCEFSRTYSPFLSSC